MSHDRPWGWKVSAYLWTKSISAGAFFACGDRVGVRVSSQALALRFGRATNRDRLSAPTLALLVFDLKRPERFLRILLMPQWKSWLVIGGYILLIYGGLLAAWMASRILAGYDARRPCDDARRSVRGDVGNLFGIPVSDRRAGASSGTARSRRCTCWCRRWSRALLASLSCAQARPTLCSPARGAYCETRVELFCTLCSFAGALIASAVLMLAAKILHARRERRKEPRAARLISTGAYFRQVVLGRSAFGLGMPCRSAARRFGASADTNAIDVADLAVLVVGVAWCRWLHATLLLGASRSGGAIS